MITILCYLILQALGNQSFSVKENSEVDYVVGQLHPYHPTATYNLTESCEWSNFFKLDKATGVIKTASIIDRDNLTSPTCNFRLNGQFQNGTNIRIIVKIEIEDVNDNKPYFVDEHQNLLISKNLSISENIDKQSLSLGGWKDIDSGRNARLKSVELRDYNVNWPFQCVLGSGVDQELRFNILKRLDREQQSRYNLTVRIQDDGSTSQYGELNLIIDVLDVNDNSPVFNQTEFVFRTLENTTVPYGLGVVTATDADSGENGRISYSLSGLQANDPFLVDEDTGSISVHDILDRETITEHQFYLTARDNGASPHSAIVPIRIVVEDINDNSPVITIFSQLMTADGVIEIEENVPINTHAASILVTDEDDGVNKEYDIKIEGGDFGDFRLEVSNGEILLTADQIDRETHPGYDIMMAVTDRGTPSRTTTKGIVIKVTDVNDNKPVFEKSRYEVDVNEDIPINSNILNVKADDADEGVNAETDYSIISQSHGQFFTISATGVISNLEKLDAESHRFHLLNISANDHLKPDFISFTTVEVTVKDVNDNTPTFNSTLFRCLAPESLSVDAAICAVTATDKDSGKNGMMTYSLEQPSPYFKVDSTSGTIRVSKKLDYESVKSHKVFVKAEDQGAEKRSSTCEVIIQIDDVNDEIPVCDPLRYTVHVPSDTTFADPIAQVQCTDADKDDVVSYTLVSPSSSAIEVDMVTGFVILKDKLSFNGSNMIVNVKAEDITGKASLENVRITVVILQSTDTLPIFSQLAYFLDLPENTVSPSIETLKATTKLQCNISYSIASTSDHFQIDILTGVLSSKAATDFEMNNSFEFDVVAQCQQSKAYTKIKVTILDENDNPPHCQAVPTVSVSEGTSLNSTILSLDCRDADSGANAQLRYSLTSDHFLVHPESGNILLSAQLDRETQSSYDLNVETCDKGTQSKCIKAIIRIQVGDINDNCPEIQQPFSFTVPEDAKPNDKIGTLRATDPDLGQNAQLSFSLINFSPDLALFGTGDIIVVRSLDYETKVNHFLNIKVTDNGTPTLSSTKIIEVTVTDVNDNPPLFDYLQYNFTVQENAGVPLELGSVGASDKDNGANKVFSFSVGTEAAGFMKVNATTGKLTLVKSQDYEATKGRVEFDIIATDQGIPPLQSKARVVLTIEDVNDHSPVFGTDNYVTTVAEDINIGDTIPVSIRASDKDGPLFSKITYSTDSKYFLVDRDKGMVTLKAYLDFETKRRHAVTITARDNGKPSLETNASLVVMVSDVNDNDPEFGDIITEISVVESTSPGTIISVVNATDADFGNNGLVSYSLTSENPSGYFRVEASTGALTLLKKLHFRDGSTYTLTIEARDNGSPSRSDTVSLSISVIDVNDNAPVFTDGIGKIEVAENTPIGSVVFTVKAEDNDSASAGVVRYTTSSPGFTVDPASGKVCLKAALDRETHDTIRVKICATDQALPVSSQLSTCKDVSVIVTDVNDNSPQIMDDGSEVFVSESAGVGSYITRINVTDADAGENSSLVFDIKRQAPVSCVAVNRDSGDVTLSRAVDYEAGAVGCTFELTVLDRGSPPRATVKSYNVIVLDANDNDPQFLNPAKQRIIYLHDTIPRDSAIFEVSVDDADDGAFGQVKLSLTTGASFFDIDPDTGVIRTKLVISQGFPDQSVVVMATDGGIPPRSNTMTLSLKYSDKNTAPECETTPHDISIREDEPVSTLVTQLSCYDLDWGEWGRLSYTIVDGNPRSIFNIHANGEVFIQSQPDYELVKEYHLKILVADKGKPSLPKVINTKITITNINDNPPVFEAREEFIDISEDASVPAVLKALKAVDIDGDKLSYSITAIDPPCKDYIKVENTSILLVKQPTGEHFLNSWITVNATDGVHSTSKVFTFRYIDVDNHAPVFYSPESFNVVSSASLVGVAGATDEDTGDWSGLQYAIVNAKRSADYTINPVTGVLECKAGGCPTTTLKVRVSGRNTSSTRDISITMVTSSPPGIFSQSAEEFDVDEDADVRITVGMIGVNQKPDSLKIGGGNVGMPFTIDGNNNIQVAKKVLDRELYPKYTLTIVGTLNGISEFCTIVIRVNDINDNPPVFNPTLTHLSTSNAASKGDVLGSVMATDPDDPDTANGKIRYRLLDNNENFAVDSVSGSVTVMRIPNTVNSHMFSVKAHDLGNPSLTSNILDVMVTVTRTNIEPVIQPPRFIIYASSPTNALIGKIEVYSSSNEIFVFTLAKPNSWVTLYESGYLLQNGPITDSVTSVDFTVVATSRSNKTFRASLPVSIPIVKSICDPNPCLNEGTCYDWGMEYSCTCKVGTKGKNCECSDRDCSNGGLCHYYVSNETTVCLCEDGSYEIDCSEKSTLSIIIIASAVGGTVVIIVIFIAMILLCISWRKKKQKSKEQAQTDFNRAINDVPPVTSNKRLKGQLKLNDSICLNPINVTELGPVSRPPSRQYSYTNHEYDPSSPAALEVLAPATPRSFQNLHYPESDSGHSSSCAEAVIFRKLYEQQGPPGEENAGKRRDKDSGLSGSINTLCYDVDLNNRDNYMYNRELDNINYLNDWRPHVQNIMNCLSLDDIDAEVDGPIREEFV